MDDIREQMKKQILTEIKSDSTEDLKLTEKAMESIVDIQLDMVLLKRFNKKDSDTMNKRIIEGIEFSLNK